MTMLFLRRTERFIRTLGHVNDQKCRFLCDSARISSITNKLKNGPGLKEFITQHSDLISTDKSEIPYLRSIPVIGRKQKIFFDIYGCQMNVSDTEIVWSILKNEGFEKTECEDEADIFLVMTCAIREGAESKIWHRLDHLRGFKKRRANSKNKNRPVKIGILGCMAERLKEKLIEKEKSVDIGLFIHK